MSLLTKQLGNGVVDVDGEATLLTVPSGRLWLVKTLLVAPVIASTALIVVSAGPTGNLVPFWWPAAATAQDSRVLEPWVVLEAGEELHLYVSGLSGTDGVRWLASGVDFPL